MEIAKIARKTLDFAVLPCKTHFLCAPQEKVAQLARFKAILRDLLEQTGFLIKSKNLMFIYEVKRLLLSLKTGDFAGNSEEIAKTIDEFLEKTARSVELETEIFAENLEKLNLEDFPGKNDEKTLRDSRVLQAQLREIKEINRDLLRKNGDLQLENEILVNFSNTNEKDDKNNRNPHKNSNNNASGLKKTVKKLLELEKLSHDYEKKFESMSKQILLLKDENLKLFVSFLFVFFIKTTPFS